MRRGIVTLGLLGMSLVTFSTVPSCASRRQLEGHWEGAISQPAGAVKITADITRQADTLQGTFNLPAAAVFRWPLAIRYPSPKVTFILPSGLTFEGAVRGDEISGTIPSPTGGHTDHFYLKRQPSGPAPYRQEEVTFQSDGFTLAGTLRVPLAGRHPAMCLLTGSGDVDREGESFYADYFARQGIVTLVYDKRGTGNSGGDYREESFDNFAADALAGIDFLKRRREVDPHRIGLYGRSHGGMVIPLAASRSKDVAFIINVGGAGVSPHEQVTYQAEVQMRHDGFSEDDIAKALAYMHQKWEVARTGGKGWEKLQASTRKARDEKWLARAQPAAKLEDIVPSWRLQMGYDPFPALEGVKCPILAVFGEMDTFTPVTQTTANYRKAAVISGNRDLTIQVFPNADHSLLVWPRANDPAHWPLLADGFLDVMKSWIDSHVGLGATP